MREFGSICKDAQNEYPQQDDMPIVIGEPHYRGKEIGRKVLSALVRRGRAEPLQPRAKAGNENNAKENVFMDEAITQKLFALQDETYQAFQSKLMPTVSPETIIGVRTPLLRKLAKELSGTDLAEAFLNSLPHGYYEENNLHAFLVENIRDYDRALAETGKFLPYIILTIGPPATAFAPRFLQSIKKNCWCAFAGGWIPTGSILCAMPWEC